MALRSLTPAEIKEELASGGKLKIYDAYGDEDNPITRVDIAGGMLGVGAGSAVVHYLEHGKTRTMRVDATDRVRVR